MLFEIYEELGEGEHISGAIVLQKILRILGIKELDIPRGWLKKMGNSGGRGWDKQEITLKSF